MAQRENIYSSRRSKHTHNLRLETEIRNTFISNICEDKFPTTEYILNLSMFLITA